MSHVFESVCFSLLGLYLYLYVFILYLYLCHMHLNQCASPCLAAHGRQTTACASESGKPALPSLCFVSFDMMLCNLGYYHKFTRFAIFTILTRFEKFTSFIRVARFSRLRKGWKNHLSLLAPL